MPVAAFFQISNQQTLGESESAILERLQDTLENIVQQEKMAREKLMEDDGLRLVDKISRTVGSLKHCHLIQSSEAMDHLSLIRLAADFGFFPKNSVPLLTGCLLRYNLAMYNCPAGKPIEPENVTVYEQIP